MMACPNVTAFLLSENPCKKPETDSECVDDTKHLVEFFYKDLISYKPEGMYHKLNLILADY